MINLTFNQLFSYDSLYKAHLRGRKCKRDKKPLIKFEMTMVSNLYELHKSLMQGSFSIGRYNTFTVEEPKRREIQTLHYSARIVQHVLCDEALTPYFTKRAIIDNCVCQKGKGTHFALDRFQNGLHNFVKKHGTHGYFLKCDILKYFPSIPHDKLKALFCSQIRDKKIKDLLTMFIDSYSTAPEYLDKYGISYTLDKNGQTGRGIPIGNQTSQLFGMFYLDKLDRLIKEKLRIKLYTRYMDDFILVHEDKKYIIYAYREIQRMAEELGLTLNSKTQIFPIKNGVTYLGFRFTVLPTGKILRTVKKTTGRRLKSRARLVKKAYLEGLIDSERVRCSLSAFHGHLSHGNCYKIEKQLANKLKAYAYQGILKRSKHK